MKIGVVHPNLNLKGGAEYVTIEIIEALKDTHDVELITFEEPELENLNSYYDTKLEETGFSVRKPVSGVFFSNFQGSLFKLRNHRIKRYAKKHREDYDLLISGMDEADFGEEGLQYVHFPESVNEQVLHETGEITTDLTSTDDGLLYTVYLEVVEKFFKEDKTGVEQNKTLCNSGFTREIYEQVFDNSADVLNPPVSMEIEDKKKLTEREDGLLCIGKINRTKGQKEVIEILDKLQENQYDIHLHLIGSLSDTEYCREVEKMAKNRDYVYLEGRVDRERLKEMIASHKYGIHNFEGEHYGLAPAEMVKGNFIPFVPHRGGPRDIVENREELIFEDSEDAVSKISKVLENDELQQELFSYVKDIDLNSPKDFRKGMREAVERFENR